MYVCKINLNKMSNTSKSVTEYYRRIMDQHDKNIQQILTSTNPYNKDKSKTNKTHGYKRKYDALYAK
jgi:hypothetical protein